MTERRPPRPVVLCILDGWGHRDDPDNNAIAQAGTPNWDGFLANAPHALLDASEQEVGLPAGQMGNSEVGHMNLGAGRVVLQDLPRIDAAVADGSLATNARLQAFTARLVESGGTAHLMGLLSPGGVHAHQDHIAALAGIVARAGVPVVVHAFLDGRDTPPASAKDYMVRFLKQTAALSTMSVGTVSGRYYAMDRDKRWERIELAYQALVEGIGEPAADPVAAITASYAAEVTDEFMKPAVVGDYAGMRDGDGILMANFRADRARQMLHALLDPVFEGFARPRQVTFAAALGMVAYSEALDGLLPAIFRPQHLEGTLGEIVAGAGLSQLRIAETEKYAHVTFFLNGGEEREFPGEERILVPSPKVATYDLKPDMSAREVTDKLVSAIAENRFDLIVVNYANTDMVGHTGKLAAAITAVETVDTCLGRLSAAVEQAGGALLITADHGNAEQMRDPENDQAHTAHTRNLVPIVLAVGPAAVAGLRNGRLADVAPTVIALMGLAQPTEMTGASLLVTEGAAQKEDHRHVLA
ncbi:MAG: 2,3-bisphosphoglycerate-independent phosphoglycerate mutase [Alphaproteobacteria bacterium]|nr:2,3-bisphosphoglycerate-independent phosphoglycerate mutase [Alphaproteobacteria bacterium]